MSADEVSQLDVSFSAVLTLLPHCGRGRSIRHKYILIICKSAGFVIRNASLSSEVIHELLSLLSSGVIDYLAEGVDLVDCVCIGGTSGDESVLIVVSSLRVLSA